MSFILSAPWPAIQTTSVLPPPQFSDSESLAAEVKIERAQDGTAYSYVKTKGGRRKLIWTFLLNRAKALELRAFIKSYNSSRIQVTDHKLQNWQGFITTNPNEFDTRGRGRVPASPNDVAAEKQSITIEFEGVEI